MDGGSRKEALFLGNLFGSEKGKYLDGCTSGVSLREQHNPNSATNCGLGQITSLLQFPHPQKVMIIWCSPHSVVVKIK